MRPVPTIKKISIIIIAAFLFAGGAGIIRAHGVLRGEGLSRIIEKLLEERISGGISLGAARLSLFPSPGLIFVDCAAGDPDSFHVSAKYAEVEISPWHLLAGRVRISRIRLIRPFVTINVDALKVKRSGKSYLLPSIEAHEACGRVLYGGREIIVTGGLSGEFTLEKREGVRIDGHALFRSSFVFLGNKPFLIDGLIGMSGGEIRADGMRLSGTEGRAGISGTLSLGARPRFQGSVSLEDAGFTPRGGGFRVPENLLADADITLLNCRYRGIAITRANAHAEYKNGRLRLQGIELRVPEGLVSGSMELPPGGPPHVDLEIMLHDAPLESYIRAFGNSPPGLSGLLDLRGRIHGGLDAPSGELGLLARRGRVKGYTLVSKVFSLLNVYRILKKRRLSLSGEGMEYEWMAASVSLKDGIAEIRNFSLDSASFQVAATGVCDLTSRTMDVAFAVQPIETLDRTIGALPVVGWVLAGDSRRFIVLRLRARGRIEDPLVRVELVETLAAPITRSIGRVLGLPLQILTAPQKLLPR